MKVALCQMDVVAGGIHRNMQKMQAMIEEAAIKGADLVVFSEMCLTGYMVGDAWEDRDFLEEAQEAADRIRALAAGEGVAVVFGNVTPPESIERGEDGRPRKYNSVVLGNGTTHGMIIASKRNLPNYREFDDKRHFFPGESVSEVVLVEGYPLTASVCEDGWDDDYPQEPVTEALEALVAFDAIPILDGVEQELAMGAHLNLSCSPFTKGKNAARHRRFAEHSKGFDFLCYVNNVGIQNNGKNIFAFDGGTTLYVAGEVMGALPPLEECIGYFDVGPSATDGQSPVVALAEGPWQREQRDPKVSDVLAYGIRKFLGDIGAKKVVIGLSGGIDSALSAMLHVKAVGAENVLLVNMPSEHNSGTTRGIAARIASNLGCQYEVVGISGAVEALKGSISGGVTIPEFRWDDENIQARMRGAGIQAALAAGVRGVFPNNGNKAETTVGYCTLAGDHMGYLAPLADLWKHEVYQIAKELSDEMGGVLPEEIFTLRPSAELSAAQSVDAGLGDPLVYWYHERLFQSWVEPWERVGITTTLKRYASGTLLQDLGLQDKEAEFLALFPDAEAFIADLERWWGLFKGLAVAKRVQSPPILVVSRRAFGYDYRESMLRLTWPSEYLRVKMGLLGFL